MVVKVLFQHTAHRLCIEDKHTAVQKCKHRKDSWGKISQAFIFVHAFINLNFGAISKHGGSCGKVVGRQGSWLGTRESHVQLPTCCGGTYSLTYSQSSLRGWLLLHLDVSHVRWVKRRIQISSLYENISWWQYIAHSQLFLKKPKDPSKFLFFGQNICKCSCTITVILLASTISKGKLTKGKIHYICIFGFHNHIIKCRIYVCFCFYLFYLCLNTFDFYISSLGDALHFEFESVYKNTLGRTSTSSYELSFSNPGHCWGIPPLISPNKIVLVWMSRAKTHLHVA